MTIAYMLIATSLLALLIHMASGAAVVRRTLRMTAARCGGHVREMTPITIVRPVSQADAFLSETLESTFGVIGDGIEIIFCAARDSDPAVKIVRDVLARHPGRNARLLIGSCGISQNPKLNNCVKGWQAAAHDLVALVDSNVLLPPDYLAQMLSVWDDNCGLVTSPPVGARPDSFWAHVECAFLNTHQARWQLLADELGAGFAQGKNLMFRKSILEPLGGIESLAAEPAEDAAATKVLRAAGYHVRLAPLPFPQPLGRRSAGDFWRRQVRWAKLRRATFPAAYVPEILAGSLPALIALTSGLSFAGHDPVLPLIGYGVIWFGAEQALARRMGWQASVLEPVAMLTRDFILPLVWIAGWIGNGFEWQGHRMSIDAELATATTE
jgi:ceramide glucosyltransferase